MYIKTMFNLKKPKHYQRNYRNQIFKDILLLVWQLQKGTLILKHLPREDTYISLQNSYILLQFNVRHKISAKPQCPNNDAISSKNLVLLLLLLEQNSAISVKHLEEVESLYVASLMHKLLSSSAAGSTDLLYGFEKTNDRREEWTHSREAIQIGLFLKENKVNWHLLFSWSRQSNIRITIYIPFKTYISR